MRKLINQNEFTIEKVIELADKDIKNIALTLFCMIKKLDKIFYMLNRDMKDNFKGSDWTSRDKNHMFEM